MRSNSNHGGIDIHLFFEQILIEELQCGWHIFTADHVTVNQSDNDVCYQMKAWHSLPGCDEKAFGGIQLTKHMSNTECPTVRCRC